MQVSGIGGPNCPLFKGDHGDFDTRGCQAGLVAHSESFPKENLGQMPQVLRQVRRPRNQGGHLARVYFKSLLNDVEILGWVGKFVKLYGPETKSNCSVPTNAG